MVHNDNENKSGHHDHHDCGHDHHHDHDCGHDHHHDHDHAETRHAFSGHEIAELKALSIGELRVLAHDYMDHDAYGKAVPVLEILFDKLPKNEPTQIEVKEELALLYNLIDETEKSIPYWKELVAVAKSEGQDNVCELLFHLGSSLFDLGEDGKARNAFEEALSLAKKGPGQEWIPAIEQELALVERNAGHLDVAEALLKSAAQIRRDANDGFEICLNLLHLGEVFEEQKKTSDAKAAFEEALVVAKKNADLSEERKLIEENLARLNSSALKSKLTQF